MLHEEGKLIICPYNTAHMIRQKRMQTHLVKCRRNYPTQDFQICPMDVTHHVPKQELEYHMENCPSRFVVDRALVEHHTDLIAPPLPKAVVDSLLPQTEESWEDACHPSYDPRANAATRDVVRTLSNARPAEKKNFQINERLRLIRLKAEMAAQGPVPGTSQQQVPEDGTVRMPKSRSQAASRI